MALVPPSRFFVRILSIAWFGAALATVSVVASPAAAEEADEDYARQLFAEGREYFEDGEYGEAADRFVEAYEILEVPELLYNIGQAYRRDGQLAAAEEYFQQYLQKTPDPPNEDEVADIIIDIQQELAAQSGVVNVFTDPQQTEVVVEETDKECVTPCEFELPPGSHTLRAERDGYESASEVIEIEANEELETTIVLEEIVHYGELVVDVDVDDATLEVDDRDYALPRTDPVELETGLHTIAIEHNGDAVEHDVEIDRDQQLHLFVPLAETGGALSPLRASAIGLGGASVALAVAGALAGFQARSTHESLQSQHESMGTVAPDLVDSGKRQQTIANGLWIGAAVTLATGAGLWSWEMFDDGDDSERELEPTEDDSGDDDPAVDKL